MHSTTCERQKRAHVCLILIVITYYLLGPDTVVGTTCLPRYVTSSNVEHVKREAGREGGEGMERGRELNNRI